MIIQTPLRFSLLWLGFLTLCHPVVHAGKLKCWTNDDGVYSCGNVVPPQYAHKGHDELNSRGRVVEEIAPEKTKEEREALLAEEQSKEEALRLKAEQEAEDQKLLIIYPSENAISRARDGKLASIDAAIKVANNQMAFYQKSLEEAEKAMDRSERRASKRKIDQIEAEKLVKHINYLKAQIARFKQDIADKHTDKVQVNEKFDGYLKKYQQIKQRILDKRNNR